MGVSGVRRAAAVLCLAVLLALPASAGGPVTITFWHGMSGLLVPAITELTRDFNTLNPGIVVTPQYQGTYPTLNHKLIAAVAAGTSPTITQLFPNWTEALIRANALVPAEQFIHGPDGLSAENLNDILPMLREESTVRGVLWTMPFNKQVYLLFYNADLLKEQQLKVPQTWDDLVTVAKALTKEKGGRVVRYGFAVRPTVEYFTTLMLTNGGAFFGPGEKEFAFNSPAGVEALQFLVDVVLTHKAAYVLPGLPEGDFGAGKVAMYLATTPGLAFAKAAVAGTFTIGLAPPPFKRVRATLLTGTNVGIAARATPEQQAAAWKYLKFITGTTGTTRWSLRTFSMPVRRSARDSTLMQVYLRDHPEHAAGLDSLAFARTDPSIAEWDEVREILGGAVEEALLGKRTAQQALDDATTKANRLLAQRR